MVMYFVRHGQTDMNAKKLIQGRIDEPLNSQGKLQARLAGEVLKQKDIDYIYTSPLLRALMTAEIIAYSHPGAPLIVDKRLTELDVGSNAGKNIKKEPLCIRKNVYKHPELFGGETAKEFAGRVKSFYTELKCLPEQAHVLVVAHSGIYDAFSRMMYHKKTEIPNNGEIVEMCKKPKDLVIVSPILGRNSEIVIDDKE